MTELPFPIQMIAMVMSCDATSHFRHNNFTNEFLQTTPGVS